MARDVRVQAVFDSSGAISSLNAYTAAIGAAIAANNNLGAAIRGVTAAIAAQTADLGSNASAARSYGQAHASSIQNVARQYAALAAQAAAAAAQIRNAHNQAPPNGPNGGGGGGRGGAGGGGGSGGGFMSMPGAGLATSFIAGYSLKSIISETVELTDKWTMLNGRLQLTTQSTAEFRDTQAQLFEIAQRMRVPFEEAVNQFSRLSFAGSTLKLTTQQTVALTEALTNAGKASFRTTSEIKSLITQFPQMLSAGKAGSDEWRSMKENFPLIVDTIAKNWRNVDGSIGTTRQKLERIVRDGKGFSDEIVNAILRGMPELEAKAAQVPRTFGESLIQLKNAWMRQVGEMAERTGFTDRMTAAVDKLISTATGPGGMSLISMLLSGIEKAANLLADAVSSGAVERFFVTVKDMIPDIVKALADLGGYIKSTIDLMNSFGEFRAKVAGVNIVGLLNEKARTGGTSYFSGSQDMSGVLGARASILNPPPITLDTPAPRLRGSSFDKGDVPLVTDAERPEDKQLENLRKNMQERIALLKEQITLEQARVSLGQVGMIEAAARVEIEKQITADMREKLPAKAQELELLIKQKAELQKAREIEASERPAKERIAQIREEIGLKQAEMTGNERLIDEARTRLAVEKAITEDLRRRNPVLAEALELAERQRAIAERTAKDVRAWTDLYERMGNTLVDSMMSAGKEGRSFAQAMGDAGKQMAEMLFRALVLEPLVKSIAGGMGLATGRATGANPGNLLGLDNMFTGGTSNAGGGLFGSLFGGGGDVGLGSWGATVVPFASGGVVSGATAFQHAGGLGVMGEAGAEAIMPLRKTKDGSLGVIASGSNGNAPSIVNYTFHVAGDLNDDTRMRLVDDMHRVVDQREPGIVKGAVSTVRSTIQAKPSFTQRR